MLDNIAKLTNRKTRLFTAENVYGEKGKGGMADLHEVQEAVKRIGQEPTIQTGAAKELGQKWKVRPCFVVPRGSDAVILDTDGPGNISHIWITMDKQYNRDMILRMYWDGETEPSVESPVGDFFCQPFHKYHPISAVPISVNPENGMNCFFPMPFRRHAKFVLTNLRQDCDVMVYYAVSMIEREVENDEAYFHAKFNRTHDTNCQDYVILDGVKGKGQYVGTAIGWQQNSDGWWGEGEVKAFIDGDTEFPTYVGTGTEDYFGGAWCFNSNFSAPFMGYKDLMNYAEGRRTNTVGNRHAMYRFHIMDPIYFESDLKVTIQCIGWRTEGRYLPLRDDVCSVAYWYQAEPHAAFGPMMDRNDIESI